MKSNARLLALGLKANLLAGTRLALFLRVSPLDFRVSAGHYALLASASLVFWLAGGMVRQGFPGTLDLSAFTIALAQIPLLLFACLLVAWIFGQSSLLIAFAVLLTSSDLLFEIVGTAIQLGFRDQRLAGYAGTVNWIYIVWALATLLRTQWLLTGWRPRRSLAAGGVLALTLALFVWVLPRSEGWTRLEEAPPTDSQPSVVREDLFHLQGGLLEARLSELEAGSEFTWFGRALFDQALRRTYSLTEAFGQARRVLAERERAQGYEPSNPQMFVGAAMSEKLASIRRRLEAAAPSASIRAAR